MEKSGDEEAPLLASYDGVEFASIDRPSKLLHGRASFKLKISQVDMEDKFQIFVCGISKFLNNQFSFAAKLYNNYLFSSLGKYEDNGSLYMVILSFVFEIFESFANWGSCTSAFLEYP